MEKWDVYEKKGERMKLSDFEEVIKIEKGWSNETKYRVTDKTGQIFLLRISAPEQFEAKKQNLKICKRYQPLEFQCASQ